MVVRIHSAACAALFTLFLVAIVPGTSAQQTAHVVYLEGHVSFQHGQEEAFPVEIGDELSSAGVLTVHPHALVELRAPGGRILLTRAGGYPLEAIFSRHSPAHTGELRSMVRTGVRRLSQDVLPQRSAVAAGVRGSQVDTAGGALTWAGNDLADELIVEAFSYLDAGLYRTARETLEDAGALGADGPEYVYLLGYLSYLTDDLSAAYELLSRYTPDTRTAYYAPHALLLSRIYYDGFAYAEAAGVLRPVVEHQLEAAAAPAMDLVAVLVLSLDAMGRGEEAQVYLDRVAPHGNRMESRDEELLRQLLATRQGQPGH